MPCKSSILGKVVLNRPVHLRGNERQDLNVGTEPPIKLATNSMQATTHRLSTMRRVGNRAWNLAIHLRAKAVNHKLINNAVWSPHFAQRPAVSSQSTQRWTQLSTKLSSLSLMTNLYNNASSAKSCNSLTQASYHRERVVDVSVNTRRTLTTYPHPGLTAA